MPRILAFIILTGIATNCLAQNTYKEVTLVQLLEKIKQGEKNLVVLDVRSSPEYMDTTVGGRQIGIGRVKGAINIPITDILQKPEAIRQLDAYKDKEIYVVCSHSYRSRRVSNHLLQNGFTHINNVQGGMTEMYRDDESFKNYSAFIENNIPYKNMAPSKFYELMNSGNPVTIIGFNNPPRFAFDSMLAVLYPAFPTIKNVSWYKAADTTQILEKAKAANGSAIVLFNAIGGGAADISYWLVKKGIPNVYNLIGNMPGYFEYMVNYQNEKALKKHWDQQSKIQFYTPLSLCRNMPKNYQFIDLRHDTSFNQVTKGTKLDYKTLKNATHFPFYKSGTDFSNQFPDKSRTYVILAEQGYKGVELAKELSEKGYKVGWIIGGIERWEWYTNNIPDFKCGDYFVK